MERRRELMSEKHELPSRYWEPAPDESDIEVPVPEPEFGDDDSDELPFT